MIYIVDIDNTICITKNSDYINSVPLFDRIQKINKLYNKHTIIYWTARGSKSGQNLKDLTEKQLDSWGCLRHKTIFEKPNYDMWIDDKAINSEIFFNET